MITVSGKLNRLRKIAFVGIGLILLFFLVDMVIMPWYVDHGTTQIVPDVQGMPLNEARVLLSDENLEPVEAETRPDPVAPAGTIVGQNPAAGSRVKLSRRIYLSVSGGEILLEVPSLRGLSVRDARFALERAGFSLGSISYAPSDTFFLNTIMDQTVRPGSSLPKGKAINVTVSQGKDPDQQRVPDLLGMTVAEASEVLTGEGLRVGRVTYQSSSSLVPNTIIDQFPRPGSPSGAIRVVDLFVVKLGGEEPE